MRLKIYSTIRDLYNNATKLQCQIFGILVLSDDKVWVTLTFPLDNCQKEINNVIEDRSKRTFLKEKRICCQNNLGS